MSGSSFEVQRVIETSILFYISHLSSAPFASLHIFSLALSNHLNNYGFFLYQLCMHYIFSFASVYGNHFFFLLFQNSSVLQFFFCLFVSILFSFLFLYFILEKQLTRGLTRAAEEAFAVWHATRCASSSEYWVII